MAYDKVDEDSVYTCVGHPLRKDIENIVYWVLNDSFTTAYNSILSVPYFFGYKMEFFFLPKQYQISRSVLSDRSRSLGLFRNGETRIIKSFIRMI